MNARNRLLFLALWLLAMEQAAANSKKDKAPALHIEHGAQGYVRLRFRADKDWRLERSTDLRCWDTIECVKPDKKHDTIVVIRSDCPREYFRLHRKKK